MSFYQENTHQNSFDPMRTEESRKQSNSPSGTQSRKHLKKDPASYQQLQFLWPHDVYKGDSTI